MERITTEAALGSLRDTLPGQAREQAVAAQDQAAAKQVQFGNATAGQKLKAAVGEWDTLNLYRYAQRQVGDAPIDPNFNFKAEAAEVIRDFGLPANDHTLSRLYSAVNSEELAEFALELKEQQDRRELLDNSGLGYSLITGLDPGMLAVDALTWGATRAFRAGKLASAVAGASANTAYLGVVDATDEREVSALEYGLTAGLSAGAFALWGGQRGIDLDMGKIDWRGREISKANTMQQMFNELTSEVDKLTPTPATRDLLMDVIDDPVRRGVQNNNAASNLRRLRNQFDGEFVKYTDELTREVRKLTGMGWVRANADVGGKFSAARDQMEEQVAGELLRRDREFSLYGVVSPDTSVPEHITRLADLYQEMHNKAALEAKRAGLLGFEDFTPRPGYFHRSWNADTFLAVQRQFEAADPVGGAVRGRGFLRDMFVESLRNGPAKLTRAEAKPIAQAMLTRMDAKRAGTKTDFLGSLGKTDTEAIREMLEEAGTDAKTVESIMRKIEGRVKEAGAPRYGKSRLPFDMLTEIQVPLREGSSEFMTLRMQDFIDRDLSRLADNYLQQMAGRSALAAAGVGGDDAAIAALRKQYHEALSLDRAAVGDVDSRMLQFDHLMGDFTGMRPAQAELSQMAQRAKSLASSTMLGASGLWQVAEYATLAFRYGAVQTMQEFLRGAPGVRKLLQQAGPDLKDELATVVNLDLARDVRIHPWLRQHETFIASKDTVFDRVLHAGKQFTPFLNGMKYIHAHQARMNANLALNRLTKAANGDTSAIKMLEDYGLRGAELEKVLNATRVNATLRGGNAQRMNWAGWTQDEIDSAMNAILRIMDDTILYGRPGQGASFARSGVGQILGQFTTFVSFAHNKLLRGTVQNKGYLGLAGLLAFQYPLTMLVVWANEARKGKLDENELEDIAQKAIGYTAAMGFWSDMAGIVGLTGHQAGRSVPVLGLLNAPGRIGAGLASAAQGDVAEGAWEVARGTSQLIPGVAAIPVTQLLLESIKPE